MRLRTLVLLSALSLALVVAGCGGGEEGGSEAGGTEEAAVPMAPAGTAVVTGTVNFTGTAPERKPITQINQDRECAALQQAAVYSENVVVNDNNTVKYVFVYVKEGLGDRTFPTPTEPVVFDQSGCMYKPHVFGVQAGQPIKILNSDPLLHNIHALPEKNRPFNFGMPKQGDERTQEFRTPEVMVKIKCDVHPWMGAYAGVLPHPYYSVTGDEGTFRIEGLPAGTYVLEAWHETYGTKTVNVTVGDGETQTADFSFGGAAS